MNTQQISTHAYTQSLDLFRTKSGRVKDITFDNADRALVALYEGKVQVWNWRCRSLLAELVHNVVPCRTVAAHPTLPLIASGGDDHTIKLWNSDTFECITTVPAHVDYIRRLVFHPTRPWLLSCSDDLSIKVWGITSHTLQPLHTLPHHLHYVMDLAVHVKHPDELVSVSLDGTVAQWSLTTFEVIKSTRLAVTGLNSINYDSTGDEWVVTGDKGVLLRVHRATHRVTPLKGQSDDVNHALFYDDHTILSAGADGTVRVWHCNTDAAHNTQSAFTPQRGRVWKLCSHPTEPSLCAAALDDGVQFFTLSHDPLTLTPLTPVVIAIPATVALPEPVNKGKRDFWLILLAVLSLYVVLQVAICKHSPDNLSWYWYALLAMGVTMFYLILLVAGLLVGLLVHKLLTRRKKRDSYKSIV